MKRLGIIGCGGHAIKSHILTARQAGFELRAVCDTKMETALLALIKAGVDTTAVIMFSSYEELLRSGEIDAVVITSPDEYHAEQLLAAVAHGIPVLVDKPLGINVEQMLMVKQALILAKQTKVIVTSCHPRRFDPPYVWLAHQLPQLVQEFGALVRIEMDFSYHIPSAEWKHGRSLLLDHFPHEMDYLRHLLGDRGFTAWKLHDSHDNYCVAGRTDNDVTFLCSGTRRLKRSAFPEEIRLRFDRGSCTVNTETGMAAIHDHERQSYSQSYSLEFAGRTNHTLRVEEVMRDFSNMLNGKPGMLSLADLEVNTASAVLLDATGYYSSVK
jgi:predicted dehydrogenase